MVSEQIQISSTSNVCPLTPPSVFLCRLLGPSTRSLLSCKWSAHYTVTIFCTFTLADNSVLHGLILIVEILLFSVCICVSSQIKNPGRATHRNPILPSESSFIGEFGRIWSVCKNSLSHLFPFLCSHDWGHNRLWKKISKAPDVLHKGDTVWEVLYIQPHNTFLQHSVCQANLALGFSARLTVVRASQLSVLQLVPVLVARWLRQQQGGDSRLPEHRQLVH